MATKKQDVKKTTKKKIVKEENKVEETVKIEEKENSVVEELQEKNSVKNLIELIGIILFVVVVLVFFQGTVVWNIVTLLLMLSVLIFVHELGHFMMAKLFKVHVYEFAIGMGPMVFSFRRKNDPTLYSLRALPIGGYNSIAGESYDDDDKLAKEQKMCYKPKWQRFLILIAGVTMNFILAFVLLFIIGLNGTTKQDNIIYKVDEGTPAAQAGLVPGDRIIKLNGHKIDTWNYLSVVSIIKTDSDVFKYDVQHQDGSVQTYEITPRKAVQINDHEGTLIYIDEENTVEKIVQERKLKKNEYAEVKIIGIVGDSEVRYGVKNAFDYACKKFTTIVKSMLLILGSLCTGKLSLDALSGPVGMYTVVKQASTFGILNLLYLTAYLGINLGVMNAIPFPAFDGGHILFIFIELITGKRVNEKIESICHLIGFILIFGLMIFITFKDIINLFG